MGHIDWLTKGDQSTMFFGAATRQRQIQNLIMGSIDSQGNQAITLAGIKEKVRNHFMQLFDCEVRAPLTKDIFFLTRINSELNAWFSSVPSEEEVRVTLFS